MKRYITRISWVTRLIASAVVVLFSQHALAVGTDAGTTISNQAQVDYNVGGNPQTFILSDPAGNSIPGDALTSGALATTFVVDNRVDFTLVESGFIGHTVVTPGQNGEFVQFTLQNHGNSTQDFRLVATNLVGGIVAGQTDTEDMSGITVYVDNNGDGLTTATDPNFVEELIEGDSVDIYVVATAPVTMANGAAANINLQAIVADAGGPPGLGADTTDDAGSADTAGIDVVFAEGLFASGGTVFTLGDGILDAQDGFIGSSAALSITKTASLISDPFNGTGADRKAIPGAVVEYVISVANSGAEVAEDIVITDTLSTEITIVDDYFGVGGEVQIDNDGAITLCSQEAPDTDNCSFAAGALSVGADSAIDVDPATTLTITFRVTIN
ncbi:MAG: hypothetical protein OEW68_00485 [Gammaproteobacteria bacterium]|nr:hypothetical protein [Gammaproteobacteria bacterium]MDH4313300.1 hypothetical protein [Gammaproteobacteria bacterium]MDH5212899.1 hypothetical protein [Gammaproteobacteria bacterium]MDH5499789.1 hypothetical protein [Gammaproteobacteria bacterium]